MNEETTPFKEVFQDSEERNYILQNFPINDDTQFYIITTGIALHLAKGVGRIEIPIQRYTNGKFYGFDEKENIFVVRRKNE